MEIKIEINGEEVKLLFYTDTYFNVINYEGYVKIGQPKLTCDVISISDISKEIVHPLVYFLMNNDVDGVPIFTYFYVLNSLTYDVVSGTRLMR